MSEEMVFVELLAQTRVYEKPVQKGDVIQVRESVAHRWLSRKPPLCKIADGPKVTQPEPVKTEPEPSKVSNTTLKALHEFGISLEDAKSLSKDELLQIKGIGEKSVKEILG